MRTCEYDKIVTKYIKSNPPNAVFSWIERIKTTIKDEDNMNRIKEVVFDKLNELIKIDAKEATRIVEEWYGQDHEIVISKITDQKLKLTYLNKLIESKKPLFANMEAKERNKFTNFLIEFLELKCIQESENIISGTHIADLKEKKEKKDTVYYILIEYQSMFPIDESMKICEKYSIKDGHAFLIESKEGGDLGKALKLYLEKMNDLIKSIKLRSKEDYHILDQYYDCCTRVCTKDSQSELKDDKGEVWLRLFTDVYTMWNNERGSIGSLTESRLTGMEGIYQKYMSDILNCITERVPISKQPSIIKSISSKCGELDFKNYKNFILSMLKSYFDQIRILRSAKNIIGSNNSNLLHDIDKIRSTGSTINDNKCMYCNEQLSSTSGTFCSFSCKHVFHETCTKSIGGNLVCPLCLEKSVIFSESTAKTEVVGLRQSFVKRVKNADTVILERVKKLEQKSISSYHTMMASLKKEAKKKEETKKTIK